MGAKTLFIFALLGLALGIYQAKKDRSKDVIDYIFYGLMGFFIVSIAALFVFLVLIGIAWLFTS